MYELAPRHASLEYGSVASELPWYFGVDDGVVLTRRGGLMSSFAISGPDGNSIGDGDATRLAVEIDGLFQRLSNVRGWWVYINYIRVPSIDYPTNNHFSSTITALLDYQRRDHYQQEGAHYESRYIVTLLYQPQQRDPRDLAVLGMPFGKRSKHRSDLRVKFDDGISDFVRTLRNSNVTCRRLQVREIKGPDNRPLYVDEHLSFLRYCLTQKMHPVQVPDDYMLLSNHLSTDAMRADEYPQLGNKHVIVVGVRGAPKRSAASLFEVLDQFKLPLRFAVRGQILHQQESLKELEVIRRSHEGDQISMWQSFAKAIGLEQRPRLNAAAMRREADTSRMKEDVELNEHRMARITINGVFIGDDPESVEADALALLGKLDEMGFPATIETTLASRAFFGSMPGDTVNNLLRLPVKTRSLAHMFPITGVWPGIERQPSNLYPKNSPPTFFGRTTGSAPFRFCNNAVDSNGHMFIQGGTGGGKSTFLNFFISQFDRYPNAQVLSFDKDYVNYPLAKAMEADGAAKYFDLPAAADAGEAVFAPLARIRESETEREYVLALVETIMRHSNVTPSVSTRKAIRRGLMALCDPQMLEQNIKLSNLIPAISDTAVREVLKDFVSSPAGRLMNGSSENIGTAPFLFFEIGKVMDMEDRYKLPILMHFVYIQEHRSRANKPSLFILDEAWKYFQDPVMAGLVSELFRQARKKNVSVIFATQSIDDIASDDALPSLIQSECLTKVFLPYPGLQQNSAIASKYHKFLTDYEVFALSERLQRNNDYYYVSPVGRRPFALELSPFALAFCGVEGERLRLVKRLVEEDPVNWVSRYLQEIGMTEWADFYEKTRLQFQQIAQAA